jgi:mannose-6-phosphate isomerase-like protein (cupin superfamily)
MMRGRNCGPVNDLQLRVGDPAYADRLAAFFGSVGHRAEVVAPGVVELTRKLAAGELEVYMRVWNVLEPGAPVALAAAAEKAGVAPLEQVPAHELAQPERRAQLAAAGVRVSHAERAGEHLVARAGAAAWVVARGRAAFECGERRLEAAAGTVVAVRAGESVRATALEPDTTLLELRS